MSSATLGQRLAQSQGGRRWRACGGGPRPASEKASEVRETCAATLRHRAHQPFHVRDAGPFSRPLVKELHFSRPTSSPWPCPASACSMCLGVHLKKAPRSQAEGAGKMSRSLEVGGMEPTEDINSI